MAVDESPHAESAHSEWLEQVVERATRNVADGGGPFAALVVQSGHVIAEGVNRVTRDHDPTAHAEVVAIRAACTTLSDHSLAGCVLVSSCEPCPLCLSAALWARLEEVAYVADRHDAERAGFDDRVFYDLLASPTDTWPMQVRQVRIARTEQPFDAWRAQADRVEY